MSIDNEPDEWYTEDYEADWFHYSAFMDNVQTSQTPTILHDHSVEQLDCGDCEHWYIEEEAL